jgi:hypothetical protein
MLRSTIFGANTHTTQMQTDFKSKNDIRGILSKFTAVAHDWDTNMQTLKCISACLFFRGVLKGSRAQKTETAAFHELSGALSHLQHEMDDLRHVRLDGILVRIRRETEDFEMIDDVKENVYEASRSTPKYTIASKHACPVLYLEQLVL